MKRFISIFNDVIIGILFQFYKYFKIESCEDNYHKKKKNNKENMNIFYLSFKNSNEYYRVKEFIKNNDDEYYKQKDISLNSIFNGTNNKLNITFYDDYFKIKIIINHYYISGSGIISVLSKSLFSAPPKYISTNPFYGLMNLPRYLFFLRKMSKKSYLTNNNFVTKFEKKNLNILKCKRYETYLNILRKSYKILNLNRPLYVGISVGFEEISYLNNNVGLIIFEYKYTDTVTDIKKNIETNMYQAYTSNFLIHLPLSNIFKFEIREYIDCLITSSYINTDLDVSLGWKNPKEPIEELYIGSISLIKSDNSTITNTTFCTKSTSTIRNCLDMISYDEQFL